MLFNAANSWFHLFSLPLSKKSSILQVPSETSLAIYIFKMMNSFIAKQNFTRGKNGSQGTKRIPLLLNTSGLKEPFFSLLQHSSQAHKIVTFSLLPHFSLALGWEEEVFSIPLVHFSMDQKIKHLPPSHFLCSCLLAAHLHKTHIFKFLQGTSFSRWLL